MASTSWSKKRIESLPAEAGRQIIHWIKPGFGVRVSQNGSGGQIVRSYVVQVGGTTKTIGRIEHYSLDDADKKAVEWKDMLKAGKDPKAAAKAAAVAEIAKAKAAEVAGRTVGQALRDYLNQAHLSDRTRAFYDHLARKHLAGWLDRPIRKVTRLDLEKLQSDVRDGIAERKYIKGEPASGRGNVTSNHVLSLFGFLWRYEDDRFGIDAREPKLPRLAKVAERRDLVPLDKLPLFWRTLDAVPPELEHKAAMMKLGLFSGLRLAPIRGLRWSEVDLDGKVLSIPASRMKSREAFVLPISTWAVDLLRSRAGNGSPLVFPDATRAAGHPSDPDEVLDIIEEAMGRRITMHSLRRTWVTVMDRNRLPEGAKSALVGHKAATQTQSYVIYDGQELGHWAQVAGDVMALACGLVAGNVVPIKQRAV